MCLPPSKPILPIATNVILNPLYQHDFIVFELFAPGCWHCGPSVDQIQNRKGEGRSGSALSRYLKLRPSSHIFACIDVCRVR